MSKRELQKIAERGEVLREVRRRWASVEHVRAWSRVAPKLRELVIAELEETSRQLTDSPAEAEAFTSALDALDAIPDVVNLLALHIAGDDVQTLLEIAKDANRSS